MCLILMQVDTECDLQTQPDEFKALTILLSWSSACATTLSPPALPMPLSLSFHDHPSLQASSAPLTLQLPAHLLQLPTLLFPCCLI